jgi:inosose dehydratase
MHRREFLGTATAALLARPDALHIATNVYPWKTFSERDKQKWDPSDDACLEAVAATGIPGLEPVGFPADYAAKLKKHGLECRSIYVNSKLHAAADAAKSIETVLRTAESAAKAGVKLIVTNPDPIRWGSLDDKTDDELKRQAEGLDGLGAKLRAMGLTLAYHNHDSEFRRGAREFHHMLAGTDAQNVKFCLDAHWVFRGSGDSQIALFDAVRLYGSRIVELHLRQSRGGTWTEVFTADGDIDYARLKKELTLLKLNPHLVLEQAVEAKTVKALDRVAAHKVSLANCRALFGAE